MRTKNLLAAAAVAMAALASSAQYSGSRIFWDVATETTVFQSGYYARVIQLRDGRLMAACSWRGIRVCYSSNNGRTWTAPQQLVSDNVANVYNDTPDLIQLSDGTIVVGYDPKSLEPYSPERRFGVRVLRSTDNGATWSEPIFVYDAGCEPGDGCWEPSFLQLPSGELQCYFSNEGKFTSTDEQSIDVCRSFDSGLTWSEPVTASYRPGYRDGMAKAIILKDSPYIVFTIEDNGWGRGNFCATSIRCSIADNWSRPVGAGSPDRSIIFTPVPPASEVSAAPYLALLPWGETVASYQGSFGRPSAALEDLDMFVAVGDRNARNFRAVTQPFHLDDSHYANWNSVAVIDTGQVMAVASVWEDGGSPSVKAIRGYAVGKFLARRGRQKTDGVKDASDSLTTPGGDQVVMGVISRQRSTVDFAYDDSNLYLYAYVRDANMSQATSSANVLHFYIDAKGEFATRPSDGAFHFGFSAGERRLTVCERGNGSQWKDYAPPAAVNCAVGNGSRRYRVEAAIPWRALGLESAPAGKKLGVNLRIDFPQGGGVVSDTIADAIPNRPRTWMTLELLPGESVNGVASVKAGGNTRGNAAVYDIEGRKVSAPRRSIYIVGGKKVLVK